MRILIEDLRRAIHEAMEHQSDIKYEMNSLETIQFGQVIKDADIRKEIRALVSEYDAQVESLNFALSHLEAPNRKETERRAEAKAQVDTVRSVVEAFSRKLVGMRSVSKASNVKREAVPCVTFKHDVSRYTGQVDQQNKSDMMDNVMDSDMMDNVMESFLEKLQGSIHQCCLERL